ncbi:Cytochrome c oxidase assembly factor 7 [Gracilariopsis chorda]|uniref:Cytochrome c oxidase assembly factor 7 n=1 Tax=Gracilariopsis chorda TaxID=448386 RepID=A0A2V3IY16_9FLOR|nr:Cytochrome c oxidase assembly factor 7 [Gracilariopsis chorda]|eukprot:PXF47042.1 Cytochrome c oxidase assembly factor 7 [Gracilariopsis chorda]
MTVDTLAESFWFIVSAYMAAFVPWTIIANKDFISEKWKTVRNTRHAGYHNMFWSIIPFFYVIVYCIVQGLSGDYKETCAAVVATLFALLHMFRTLWGLWQLRSFRIWAENSIRALKTLGITYDLHGSSTTGKNDCTAESLTPAYIADHILINEQIVDNQIMHGNVHCFLSFGDDIDLLTHADDTIHLWDPVLAAIRWFRIFAATVSDQFLRLIGQGKRRRFTQVPLRPVEIWVRWASTFAAQGLKEWMTEFEAVLGPDSQSPRSRATATEKLFQRGRYFGAEVLASASLHLWSEFHPGVASSPFLWDAWKEDSHMTDGRLVKQELFHEALRSGEALPFGTPHLRDLEEQEECEELVSFSYEPYRDFLTEFITELPVKSIYTTEIRSFDVGMLEWLTILLHLGTLSLRVDRGNSRKENSDQRSVGSSERNGSSESSSSTESTEATTKNEKFSWIDSDQAVATLRAQLNIVEERFLSGSKGAEKQTYISDKTDIQSAFPLGFNLISLPSKVNRLVTKVGELVDVWMALVSGGQISFLLNNLNEDWEKFCLGVNNIGSSGTEQPPKFHEINVELEKRRLARRIADRNHRYGFMDHFITFMGYRMESVRTSLARWVAAKEGKCANEFFEKVDPHLVSDFQVPVQLSSPLSSLLGSTRRSKALGRRSVQCRLIWEIQNALESTLMVEAEFFEAVDTDQTFCISMMMLFILSFPSLTVTVHESNPVVEQYEQNGCCCIRIEGSQTSIIPCENHECDTSTAVTIVPICGPQKFSVVVNITTTGQCSMRVFADRERFQWQWWRDAFLGRLEGFREWQTQQNIPCVELDLDEEYAEAPGISKLRTATHSSFQTWNEWTPFRAIICKYELESDGLLQQPCVVELKTPSIRDEKAGITNHFVEIPVQDIKEVSYEEADDALLMHTCLLVQDALKHQPVLMNVSHDEGTGGNPADLLIKLGDTLEPSRAVNLYEIAAVQYGRVDALQRSLQLLFTLDKSPDDYSRGLDILQTFLGTMLSYTSVSVHISPENETKLRNHVLPECERLLGMVGDRRDIYRSLVDLIHAYLICNPRNHHERAMLTLQKVLFLSHSKHASVRALCDIAHATSCIESAECGNETICSLVGLEPKHFSAEHGRFRLELLELAVDTGTRLSRRLSNEVVKKQAVYEDIRNFATQHKLHQRGIKKMDHVRAMYSLAVLLDVGTGGVQPDARRAVEMYESLIEEWEDTYSMFNLAVLLETGAGNVKRDVKRAAMLYQRAINEGRNVEAMFSLGFLLHHGPGNIEPDEPDQKKAARLYEQAITAGNHVEAKFNLANLLQTGGDGAKPDAKRAITLYQNIIDEENHVHAMYNLALLLQSGIEGMTPDTTQAAELYERAIQEAGDVNAMYALADLLMTKSEVEERDIAKAKSLVTTAAKSQKELTVGLDHMRRVWKVLKDGSKQVRPDIELSQVIEHHARELKVDL